MPTNQPQQYQINLDRTANTPISEGVHLFVVSEIEEGESKSGNPMWTVRLACQTAGEEGKEVTTWLVLTEKARWRLELFLDAVSAPKSGAATADQFTGRKLRAQILHEEYEGKMQAKVGEMYPVSAGGSPAPTVANAAVKRATVVAPTKPVAKAVVKPVGKRLPKDATD